jgi:hypothetical protein
MRLGHRFLPGCRVSATLRPPAWLPERPSHSTRSRRHSGGPLPLTGPSPRRSLPVVPSIRIEGTTARLRRDDRGISTGQGGAGEGIFDARIVPIRYGYGKSPPEVVQPHSSSRFGHFAPKVGWQVTGKGWPGDAGGRASERLVTGRRFLEPAASGVWEG